MDKPKKFGPCKCRICKKPIDRNTEIEGVDWMMRSTNWFYHCTCYDDWISKKDDVHTNVGTDELWKDAVYQYLKIDQRIILNMTKFNQQWDSLIKKGRTPKGIYFSIRYFYDVQHGDAERAQGGIGIVNYIYQEASAYWTNKEANERGIVAKIEEQVRKRKAQQTRQVKTSTKKKTAKIIYLSDIANMEDDE